MKNITLSFNPIQCVFFIYFRYDQKNDVRIYVLVSFDESVLLLLLLFKKDNIFIEKLDLFLRNNEIFLSIGNIYI